MLTQLFSSTVRVKILKFLVMHKDHEFSAAEIAKRTGSIVRSINKELTKLIDTDIIDESVKPLAVNKKMVNVKHYHASTDFFLFKEISRLFLKMQVHDLDKFQDKIKKLGNVIYVALTGRFAGADDISIDVLLVGNIDKKKCEKVIKDFEQTIGWEVNWTLMDPDDFLYRREVGDMFIYEIMMSKKIEVINNLSSY